MEWVRDKLRLQLMVMSVDNSNRDKLGLGDVGMSLGNSMFDERRDK